jgi:DNA mismatch endonuclease (patch repair protein)
MPDVFTKAKRSEVMSRIRGRGNRETEVALARVLRRHHITGWRRHLPLAGRPDFAFRRERVVVFVDGCFWHKCPKHSNVPENNREVWVEKLTKNVQRDHRVTRALRASGWRVVRVWEHEMRRPERPLRRILAALSKASLTP